MQRAALTFPQFVYVPHYMRISTRLSWETDGLDIQHRHDVHRDVGEPERRPLSRVAGRGWTRPDSDESRDSRNRLGREHRLWHRQHHWNESDRAYELVQLVVDARRHLRARHHAAGQGTSEGT